MKKILFSISIMVLIVSASIFSISLDKTSFSLVSNAVAEENPISPFHEKEWTAICPDGVTKIKVCAGGHSLCFPEGICPQSTPQN